MIKVINFFKSIVLFFEFVIDSIFNVWSILKAIAQFMYTAFTALPLMVEVILIGVVVFSIVYKLLSLGGAGSE